ncbi:MAG: transglutaminase-like domain-containing protein [Pontiella sp.]
MRPLTTDERASFVIVSLYMVLFCMTAFLYWDFLILKIIGVSMAVSGCFLFVAAVFNTEARSESNSIHPFRSYLMSFFFVLTVLFVLRFVGGIIENFFLSVVVLYAGLIISLIVFRKAMVQVVTAMLALIFLFVTINNWAAVLDGRMEFKDAVKQCGHAVFQIGPIQDVTNMLIAGNYMTYLGKVNYRDTQINILATRQVAGAEDDELKKTRALLDFVSNDIHYVSDPNDGFEYAKNPITTLIAGGGDCEDQALVLCSLLESVGVKTYIAFTDDHVFALVRFSSKYENLAPAHIYIDNIPCYALDPADPGAFIGRSTAKPEQIKRVFDVRRRIPVQFYLFSNNG